MPSSLAAIHTSRSLGAPQTKGLSSDKGEAEKGGTAGIALPRMADAIKQVRNHPQSIYPTIGATAVK